jgi:hypothetical protein
MEKEFIQTCICCKKSFDDYVTKDAIAAIPPHGMYFNSVFLCSDCLKKWFLSNYDLQNFIYQYEKQPNFSEDLFDMVRYYLPQIFRLKRKTLSPPLKEQILKKYSYTCVFCGSKEKLSIDHKKPYSKGGSNEPTNLQVLCKSCNSKKGAKE